MKNHYTKLYDNINKSIYNISVNLIENICNDLNESDKKDFFIKKYLIKGSKKSNNQNISNIDTNNPKKNVSAYIHFTEDIRPKLQKKFPNDTMTDISKRLGKLWGGLNSKDKQKYENMAQQDKKRYTKDINKYKNIQTTTQMDSIQTKSLLDNSVDLSDTNSEFSS